MVKKFCVVCGSENFSRSKLYCCVKCKNQDYYRKNKDKLLDIHKDWIKNNSEKNKETSKKWRKENREKALEYSRKWRERNKKNG